MNWSEFQEDRPFQIRVAIGTIAALLTYGLLPFPWTQAVDGKAWTRTETAMAFQITTEADWQDRLVAAPHRDPDEDGNGDFAGTENIRDCAQQIRSYRQVPTGSHTVCSSMGSLVPWTRAGGGGGFSSGSHPVSHPSSTSHPSSSSPSSGSPSSGTKSRPSAPRTPVCHKVTDYTSVPVYDVKCTYDTYKWATVGTQQRTGTEDAPRWPDMPRPSHGRIQRVELYQIRIGDELYEVPADRWIALQAGEEVKVWRNQLFGVIALRGSL